MKQREVALTLDNLPILEKINQLQREIDKLRPLPAETEQRILQKLRLEWNYHSNAIEGNTLSYGETVAFLMHGLTAKGKPLKDHLDIRGHNEAINFLLGMVKDSRPITETDIRDLHEMVLVEPYKIKVKTPSGLITEKTIQLGKYKAEPNHVETVTGEIHYYASPEETAARMGDLMGWYQQTIQSVAIHPLVVASLFHHEFVSIHPFDDGNGRMARLLMNLILMQHELPPLVVKQNDRTNYYQVLSQADAGEYEPLVTYFGELMKRSLTIYLKGARGESLVEADDVDKEIALFKGALTREQTVRQLKSGENIFNVVKNVAFPIFRLLQEKCRQMDDLFFKHNNRILYASGRDRSLQMVATQNWNAIEKNWLNGKLKRESEDVRSVRYEYRWQGFKHTREPLDIDAIPAIYFEEYEYIIEPNNGLPIIKKLYDEYLTPEEMNQIVKEIIGKVMAEIKQKAENQSE